MPPSHHSHSSHHSSSHHSSSHSHASHHSSSSHRSSYGGSRSSSGSYRSAHNGAVAGPVTYSRLTRSRTNQPRGYHSNIAGYVAPKIYHCKKHDYIYYGTSWLDEATGISYEKGYYDENGKYYAGVLLRDSSTSEIRFSCPYCGTEVKTAWKSGEKPICNNCAAQMEQMEEDELELIPDYNVGYSGGSSSSRNRSVMLIIFGIIFIAPIMISILGAMLTACGAGAAYLLKSRSQPDYVNESTYTDSRETIYHSKTFYVEELGRECSWDTDSESYYDPVTDCYFWYNDMTDYPDWQYWYEGISSDYGDYGWMEYDREEECWYIERDYGDWIPLPEKYDASALWHIE